MCDDLIRVGDSSNNVEYPISIVFCDECKTAHQKFQIPKNTLFPSSYHYRSRHTADVLNGMRQLAGKTESILGSLDGLTVLDIGCNDGSLLSIFREIGAKTVGIEPTGAAVDARAAGHVVYEDYVTPAVASAVVEKHGQPDVITFTNVFAHIEDLSGLLESVRVLIGPRTLLVIENHYLGSILDGYQFDTFYHEHPRTYSLTSFRYIADALGLSLVATEFPHRYGGNIRVMMQQKSAGATQAQPAQELRDERDFGERLREMGSKIPVWQKAKRAQIADAVAQYGPLPAKAFPGRAAILVKLLGLDETMISAVYEKPGSMKVGHYVPGTRIPILSDDDYDWQADRPAPMVNFAWHISSEIHNYLRGRGYRGPITDIFSVDEFASFTQDAHAIG